MNQTVAEVMGGLGNQMFIYAFARAQQLAYGGRCVLVDRQDGPVAHAVCALQLLCISPEVEICRDADYMKTALPLPNALRSLALRHETKRGGMMSRDWSGFERRICPILNRFGVHFATEGYLACRRSTQSLLAWGYFQGEEYFVPYTETIRRELRPRPENIPQNEFAAALAEANRAGRTVCVHARRGDYLKPENAALQVCTPDYYRRALAAAAAALPGATFVFFSDDPDWVRENLQVPGQKALYAPAGGTAVGDLALMQQCSDFIMSNSTYSWWAQYLGSAPQKQVFAPCRWYAGGKQTALYQPFWHLIETNPE